MMLTSQGTTSASFGLRQSKIAPPLRSVDSQSQSHSYSHPQSHNQHSYSQQHNNSHSEHPRSYQTDSPIADGSLASQLQSSLAVPLDHTSPVHYMQRNYPTNPPPIRVQQPLSGVEVSHLPSQANIFDDSSLNHSSWNQYNSNQRLFPQNTRSYRWSSPAQVAGHKRSSSGSTIASTGPSSPFTPVSSTYPHIVDPDSHHYSTPPGAFESLVKSEQIQATANFPGYFANPDYRYYPTSQQHAGAQAGLHFSMRDLIAHQGSDMEGDTSLHKTPSGEFADEYKASMEARNGVPKLDRTMSDIYQDELYNPNVAMPAAPPQPPQKFVDTQNNNLSPRRDVFSERLQAANNGHMSARSSSPSEQIPRERSPFQPTSEYANDQLPAAHAGSPGPRLGSAADLRERQKAQSDARAFARHHHKPSALQNARTISPKEAILDLRDQEEDAMPPLFGSEGAVQRPATESSDLNPGSASADLSGSFQQSSDTNDMKTMPQGNNQQTGGTRRQRTSTQTPQQYPFILQPRRQNSSVQSSAESVPEFPAHLTSMESTKSDNRSSESQSETSEVRRPSSTTADTGTYSCTYHGCAMRFETPAKLQRHKRDGHRQGTPPGIIEGDLNSRNSQAGPHKCERTNPSTGKPCNSIFSRPYDLTRHEDTIHNARKLKVKCQFCTEDKTFSRNDALTRHMRVVHPEVDFPGKTKRKM